MILILAQFNNIDKTQGNIRPENDFIVIEKITKKLVNKKHVIRDTYKLNYSEWGSYSEGKRKDKKEERIVSIEKEWMPIGRYKLTHLEARLSVEQR